MPTVTVEGRVINVPEGLSHRQMEKYVDRVLAGEDPSGVTTAPAPKAEDYQIDGGDILRAAGQGLWSFGDEIEAGFRTGFGFAGDYDATKEQINREIAQARKANPWAMNGVELATGFVAPGGNIARGIKLGTKGAQTLGQAFKQGAVQGTFDGALSGLGASEADNGIGLLADTLGGAALGASIGAPAAAVIPGVGKLFARDDEANSIIREAVAESGMNAQGVNARLGQLGDQATMADLAPEIMAVAQSAQGIAGPSSRNLKMLADRNAAAPYRMADEVTTQTGSTIDSAAIEKQRLFDERQRIAAEEYAPVDAATFTTDEAAVLLDNPLANGRGTSNKPIQKAINAYAASSDNNLNVAQLEKMIAGDPEIDLPGAVPGRVLADARSFISDKVEDLKINAPNESRILGDTLRQFDDFLDQVPGYTQANANYARSSQLMGDIDAGTKFAQNSNAYGDDRRLLRELDANDPERRAALAVGAQSDLINDLLMSGGARQTGDATTRLGSAEQSRLRQSAANVNLEDVVARERTFHDTFSQLTPTINSKTSGSNQAKERLENRMSVMSRAADLVSPGRAAAKTVADKVEKRFALKNKEVAAQIADRLLKQGMSPDEVIKLLDQPEGAKMIANLIAKTQGPLQGATRAATVGILGE